ncbi:MMPL family transporter [Rhodococcus sp. IEGM 1241]|uniref:MMPL family transporter n=1 Tax=Rhodococcus sp. IEGM 1241 TaxID=3082228 RepID=UPI00295373A3|nr:MMPL family transporter [Rhodococcus sp. IEGM 1241]MDV8015520.1 MMPL family transporter [Rhodococcus sp. IEGM 1241]
MIANLRALSIPADTELLVGGSQATFDDGNSAIKRRPPAILSIMIASTLLLLLTVGSDVLPLKAVTMACLSLTATFGALTWIFQLGNGTQWIGVTPAPLEATSWS